MLELNGGEARGRREPVWSGARERMPGYVLKGMLDLSAGGDALQAPRAGVERRGARERWGMRAERRRRRPRTP
jgi:hypothetical protein